ncbi:PAS domain-containing protein [Massilia forsythiae]|uniref:histidine kinase n=1 Tax=Massilia forsythiae TaxID=2728020 RepID=A0A7Z2W098_9BURK|nr:PAS domain-containing protein [Massilia forsythiae]QJE02122.1 PAS domain-containing protein [Massilia forsythiae]
MTDFHPHTSFFPQGAVERMLSSQGASALGAMQDWPVVLRHAVRFMLDAAAPAFLVWGPRHILLYNDACTSLLGSLHPAALGRPLEQAWPQAWDALRPALADLPQVAFQLGQPRVATPGVATPGVATPGFGTPADGRAGQAPPMSCAPLRDLDGSVHGLSCTLPECAATFGSDPRFRAIADAMPQLVWSTLPDGFHDYYNRRWYDFTGMRPGSTDGDGWNGMFHADDQERAWAAWRHSLASGAPYEIEYRLRHHSGQYRWMLGHAQPIRDAGGRIVRWMGTCTDIHQQKQNEAALRDARLRQKAALVAADIGTWTYDIRADRVYADRNLAAIFGVSTADADGGPLAAYLGAIHADDLEPVQAAIRASVASGEAYECRYRVRLADGGWRHLLARGKVSADADGQPAWLPGVVVDVSRQKQAEDALRASEAQFRALADTLREADQRKDEFLAMLAHELRNPLAPITAAADFLTIGTPDEARVRQVTAIIARQASHMSGLIDDLLDVSRVTRGHITLHRAPVALAGVVAEAVEQVRPLIAAKGHQLTLELPPQDAAVLGDRKRLVQIFANVLGNAAKYTPAGGRLAVEMRVDEGGDGITVDVLDDGIGMAPELVKRAFDLFSQGERSIDRSQGGLGIGLALVRSLVELHGGRVEAHSAGPGQGSRFAIRLPRRRDPAEAAPPADAQAGAAGAAALEVMIVDDNVDAAQILAMFVEALGHRPTVWHSPARALEHAARTRPDLCVLDIGLPEFDGHELAARLRRLPGMEHAPLVAVSGYGQAEDRRRALAAGFDRHFVKPVKGEDILEVLQKVAAEKAGSARERAIADPP